jgi:hypothetical protein
MNKVKKEFMTDVKVKIGRLNVKSTNILLQIVSSMSAESIKGDIESASGYLDDLY